MPNKLNTEVTQFIDALNHPLAFEINKLREMILKSSINLSENIKWNGPNYMFENFDRITMKIQPPKAIQLIFHRGAKTQTIPKDKMLQGYDTYLDWRANDRAVMTFHSVKDIVDTQNILKQIIKEWIEASN